MSSPSPDPPDEPVSFFKELKKRKVFQVGATYLIVGWLVIQITVAVFPQFDIPVWATRFIILFVVAGFPLALILAWAFELTPEGVRTTRKARTVLAPTDASNPALQKKRNRLAILVGALLPTFFLGSILGAVVLWYGLRGSTGPATEIVTVGNPGMATPVVAVLPFLNMSPDAENAFFADGVHEDLLTNLSRLSELRVISRTSVMGYAARTIPLRQIATELHASHVVEGSVRRAGERVRVTAQLVDAQTDKHLWAERYDRDLDDIFLIQSQIAEEIASALLIRLNPDDRSRLSSVTTNNVKAYDLYLQAREIMRGLEAPIERLPTAVTLLEEAVRLDPRFADGWSLLAWVRASKVHFEIGEAQDELAAAERALRRAQTLEPDRPETLLAEAYVLYHGRREYEKALAVLERAREISPNHPEILAVEAYILRRIGRMRDSLERLEEAFRLDPRNYSLLQQMVMQLQVMGLVEKQVQVLRHLRTVAPEHFTMEQDLFGAEMTLWPDHDKIWQWLQERNRVLETLDPNRNFDPFMTVAAVACVLNRPDIAEALLLFQPDQNSPQGASFRAAIHLQLLRHAQFFLGPEEEQRHADAIREALKVIRSEEIPNPIFQVFVGNLRLVLALQEGRTADAERELMHGQKIYDSLDDFMLQKSNVRQLLVTARIMANPDKAYEIFTAELEREAPGVTFLGVASFPLGYQEVFRDPRFQQRLEAYPAHRALLARISPKYLDPLHYGAE